MIKYPLAERLSQLPPYLFAAIDKMKQEAKDRGVDIIDLGIGDPDQPTPGHIIEHLSEGARKAINHRYPSYEGLLAFREAVANWYNRRFGVKLDAKTEVLSLIGSKEGIGHIPLAFINPGEKVLIPDPGYPVYKAGTIFAGGIPVILPLLKKNKFLPDLNSLKSDDLKGAKLIFINYPNNPTAAIANKGFFEEVADFAKKHDLIVCHDAAYSEIYFNDQPPQSFLEVPVAKEVGIEFHSLSKTYNMTGWRLGFAVGNAEILAGLGKIKTNLDSGVFQAVQEAGIEALEGDQSCITHMSQIYQERRDTLVDGLKKIGLAVEIPQATFYVWISTPSGYSSSQAALHLLEKTGVVCTPG
ncbi:MAG: LL-diaminopimelate aminotransferase, partial [Candidatus Tectomicrobia bacterium]|nr:LL-diaminopimelate aminotransferase [Candidatus Tectomicrobia bacterium]